MTLMTMTVESKVSQADNNHNVKHQHLGCSQGIQTLGVTAFDELLASVDVVVAFAP